MCSGGPERRDLLKVVLRGDTLNLRFYLKRKIPPARPVLGWTLTLAGGSMMENLVGKEWVMGD